MQEASIDPALAAPQFAYLIGGKQFAIDSPGFAEAIAAAHAAHHRPRCLCLVHGIEMYVARLAGTNEGFIVKRMPNTGSHHAPDCPSYEPPAEFSGLGQVLGSAIAEDPATGETALKLGFSMSKIGGRSTIPAAGSARDSVAAEGSKLSLRGLLHYLWDQAELTRWQPGFAGKRTWSTVRKHLLLAAENKIARGDSLRSRLYIPEVFSVDQRDAINARRMAQWSRAVAAPGKPQHLMLLIAEVKEIVPARHGYKAVIKHVPDQAFALDEQIYRRLGRRFEGELSLWGAATDLRMIMIATFCLCGAGTPKIAEMSLMPVTDSWIPIEDSFERQLVDQLVREGRCFAKRLRYNMPSEEPMACALLTDTGLSTVTLWIEPSDASTQRRAATPTDLRAGVTTNTWVWRLVEGAIPPLPTARQSPTRASLAIHAGSLQKATA